MRVSEHLRCPFISALPYLFLKHANNSTTQSPRLDATKATSESTIFHFIYQKKWRNSRGQ